MILPNFSGRETLADIFGFNGLRYWPLEIFWDNRLFRLQCFNEPCAIVGAQFMSLICLMAFIIEVMV